MALKVWLPLDGDLRNLGCSDAIVINNGATISNNGKIGKCYSFDGNDDYISLNDIKLYNIFTGGTQPFSICLWVYWNDRTRAILFGDYNLSGAISMNLEIYPPYVRFYWASNPDKIFTTSTITLNQWTHIVVTYDGLNLKTYINGIFSENYQLTLPALNKTSGVFYLGRDGRTGDTALNGQLNDFRIYDHCLSAAEVHEIAQGLVLHYKLDGVNRNLGGTSADYSNQLHGVTKSTNQWGGDAGTVTFYHFGGYNNLPYKVYHKTATGSGGIHSKTANDIILEADTTYTMSCWIKASRNFSENAYGFNINRSSDNHYINYNKNFSLTTEWQFFKRTFTTSASEAGYYGEMSIIYNDTETDYYVYYSGFKIEKGDTATSWTPPDENTIIQDSSGYGYNGTINNYLIHKYDTARYNTSAYFGAFNTPNIIVSNFSQVAPALTNCTICWWGKYDTTRTLFLTGQDTTHYAAAAQENGKFYHQNAGRPIMYRDGVQGEYMCEPDMWHFYTLKGADLSSWTTLKINSYSGSWGINGLISDFRIYCTTLSDSDIKALYNLGMKVDNLGNIHTFNIIEQNRNLLAGVLITRGYSNSTDPFSNYNEKGEMIFTANATSAGSSYIEIIPEGYIYEYDFTISSNQGNMLDIGFERYDADKTYQSNNATVYIRANTNAANHTHFKGIVDLSTDGVNPCKYIRLRILNGWTGTTSGVTGQATIHNMSLRAISSTRNHPKLMKSGNFMIDEIKENNKTSFYKNDIVEVSEIIEI